MVTEKELLDHIKAQRKLGYTNKQIAEYLDFTEGTIKSWLKKKSKPSKKSLEKFKEFREYIKDETSFFNRIDQLEAKRLKKKSRTYEGEYITKDNYSVLKVVVNKVFDSKEELYEAMKLAIDKNLPQFQAREDLEFYVGCHTYCLHQNLGTLERDIQSRLNFDIYDGFKAFQKDFDKYVRQAYVNQWICVEFWVAGRHNGAFWIEE